MAPILLRGGNDLINGGLGDDQVNGGSGSDTVVLNGSRVDYTVEQIDAATVLIVGPDGRDTITNVETFVFDDLTQSFAELLLPRHPNLAATSLTAQATTLVEGEDLFVNWTIASDGDIDAANSGTKIVIASSPDMSTAAEIFGAQSAGVFAIGTETTFSATLDTTGFEAGTFYIAAVADSTATLSESDETDNVTQWIEVTVEAQSFNLAASNLTVSNTVITPMQDAGVSWNLAASGNVTGGISYSSLVIATQPDLANALEIDAVDTQALMPGTNLVQTTFLDWAALSPGTYWVAAVADGRNALSETSEADNLTNWAQITVEEERYNLAATEVTIDPASDFDLSFE